MKWPVNPVQEERLVLDEGTFQQVLAACYALQEHGNRLQSNQEKTGFAQTRADDLLLQVQLVAKDTGIEAAPISQLEPVLPVAQALAKQADRLHPNGARAVSTHRVLHGATVERAGLIQSLPETNKQVPPRLSAEAVESDALSPTPLRPELVALIAEINGLLEAKERTG